MRNLVARSARLLRSSLIGSPVHTTLVQVRANSSQVRDNITLYKRILNVPRLEVLAVVLLAEMFSIILQNTFVTTQAQVAGIGVVIAVLLYQAHRMVRKSNQAVVTHVGVPGNRKVSNRKGVIALVGLDSAQDNSSMVKLLALARNMEYFALVGTPETKQTGVIDAITAKLMPAANIDLDDSHLSIVEWCNAESVESTNRAVSNAIEWMIQRGIAPKDIVVDITKGRRHMHFGAVAAAMTHGVEVQYLALAWDTRIDKPIKGQESFKIIAELYDDGLDEIPTITPVA